MADKFNGMINLEIMPDIIYKDYHIEVECSCGAVVALTDLDDHVCEKCGCRYFVLVAVWGTERKGK